MFNPKILWDSWVADIKTKVKNIFLVIGRLLGIKVGASGLDYTQGTTSFWITALGIPLGFLLFGAGFSISIWIAINLCLLMTINLDASLLLMSNLKEPEDSECH